MAKTAKILALSNDLYFSEVEEFGLVAQEMLRHGHKVVLRNNQLGHSIPETPEDFDGVVVSGGRLGVNDEEQAAYVEAVGALLRAFDQAKRPVLGICLGGQILAHAFGGRVSRRAQSHFGLDMVSPVPQEQRDPILSTIDRPFPLYSVHNDEFSLPPDATLLMRGENHRNDLFRVGHCAYGFQPHPELTLQMAQRWFPPVTRGLFPDLPEDEQEAVIQQKLADYRGAQEEIERFASLMVAAWLDLVLKAGQPR